MPVVGQPLAFGIGFVVLLLVVFTGTWAGSLVTVAHESGHIVGALLTLRDHAGFQLNDDGSAFTTVSRSRWSFGGLIAAFAGYPLPPLLGLGGAAVVADGNAWAVLWSALALLVWAFMQAANALANAVTLLASIGVGWVALTGSPELKAAIAVGLVWLMLIGGALDSTTRLSRAAKSDAEYMSRWTLVPRIAWHGIWALIGVLCLWFGASWLLVG
ncbi:M50 family metallopeptidase [Pseudonocardia humida]|uniref:M50 family metallopeptidase n=1 Tax=Pseudonocardia humida TaxID=2800819 RepID=A0ABT1A5L9_9PSEU|nr:M50 family metallopeptidase [Pseudonocardia humida]MCO1658321.1 M50 family metallopeptidase [Pseudonocardia humida]